MSRHTIRSAASARSDRGFTIIEMLVVVTLILAVTAVVAPTFRVTPTREVENMAYLVAAHLELARDGALGRRRMIRVDFNEANSTYTAYIDHDGDGSIGAVPAEVQAFAEFGVRELEGLVEFGRGSADPLPGDAGSGAITLTDDRLFLDNQGVPTPWGTMGTIYLTHAQEPSAVSAVSIASSGSFKTWRWWPELNEWR